MAIAQSGRNTVKFVLPLARPSFLAFYRPDPLNLLAREAYLALAPRNRRIPYHSGSAFAVATSLIENIQHWRKQ